MNNKILVATKMFSDLYRTIGKDGPIGEVITQAYDSYLNSENLVSIEDHKEYKEVYRVLIRK